MAGRLIRELERKLPESVLLESRDAFALYRRVLHQKPQDKNKVFSLHEPDVYCVAKGKDHKKYEFGSKASVVITKDAGVIVGAVAHPQNIYDGHTLPEVLDQVEAVMDRRPSKAIVDRGYRGRKWVEGTEVLVPGHPSQGQSRSTQSRMRKRFRRRAAIEPVISHLKFDFRLLRCYLKGHVGDSINLLMAASAWNLRKWMREVLSRLFWILHWGRRSMYAPRQ